MFRLNRCRRCHRHRVSFSFFFCATIHSLNLTRSLKNYNMKYLHCMCISRIMALVRQSKSALPFVNFFFSSSTLSLSFYHFWLGNLEICAFYYSHTQKNHTCFDQHVSILMKWHQWVHRENQEGKMHAVLRWFGKGESSSDSENEKCK